MASQWKFLFVLLILSLTLCLAAYYFMLSKEVFMDFKMSATITDWNTTVSISSNPFEWQEIFKDFYFYSLYSTVGFGDLVEIHATITGSGSDRNFWKAGECHCVYYSTDQPVFNSKVKGFIEQLSESHWDYAMIAGRVRCPFPEAVQNSFSNYPLVKFLCQYGKLSGMLTFYTPNVIKQSPTKMTFAQCGAPMWGRVNRPAALVEFIEYYRLMGVTKFFWYDMDVANQTRDVLRYYENEGLLHITEWSLPWNSDGKLTIHYYGQVAALYDCAMKTAGTYDYTIVSADIDEFFATSVKPASFSGIMNGGSTDCAIVRSVFMDPTANYSDTFDQKTAQPVLRTARITRRTTSIFPESNRSKYICRMRYVDNPMIHSVQGLRGSHLKEVPNPETTILLHFRSYREKQWTLKEETRATVLTDQLRENVSKAWQQIFI